MNNRGNLQDTLLVIIGMFGIVITMLVMGIVINETATAISADSSLPPEGANILNKIDARFLPVMDFLGILFFIGFPLISAILAFFNNIHPLFFWLSLGFVFLVIIWGGALNVFWEELAQDSLIGSAILGMPMCNFILSNYAVYAFFVFVVIACGSFIKLRNGGDNPYG